MQRRTTPNVLIRHQQRLSESAPRPKVGCFVQDHSVGHDDNLLLFTDAKISERRRFAEWKFTGGTQPGPRRLK